MPLWMLEGDIANMPTDAVVNAANNALLPGGGVCGALHRAAGPRLADACALIGHCDTGKAVATPAFGLKNKAVIHAVGPVWQGGGMGEEKLLASCYLEALQLAQDMAFRSVAFPLISSGIYGYPRSDALRIAREAISDFLDHSDMDVYLVLRREKGDENAYRHILAEKTALLFESIPAPAIRCESACAPRSAGIPKELDELMKRRDESFSELLMRRIMERDMTNAQCYKRANMDRKLFSKIIGDRHYRPRRQTVLALAVALEMDRDEAEELMKAAGFAFGCSSPVDRVVGYYIDRGQWDVHLINEALYHFDLPLLGSPMQ